LAATEGKPTERHPASKLAIAALVALTGVLIGIGAFTFVYAEGFSYLSNDPKVCVNCHIMQPQYDSWQKASHHAVATCVDCHLPHGLVRKYLAKAENGYHHSVAFTAQNFDEPVRIKGKNSQILQENCLHCHAALVHDLVPRQKVEAGGLVCVHCHSSVGHGETTGLGGPPRSGTQD
jgi:cytochrome c nitrite reductase small subunit